MVEPPSFGPWDYAAVASVLVLLAVGYVVVPDPVVQYGVWIAVFCVWMAWFVSFGAKWLYGADV